MPIRHAQFAVANPEQEDADEIAKVGMIADAMRAELERSSAEIESRHVHAAQSNDIQNVFFPWLEATYTVKIECTEGFENTATRGNRADAQLLIDGDTQRRILIEVERGGTVTNNHDLKDIWKAHLSPLVQHLFLVVPNAIVDGAGAWRSDQAFRRCQDRLGGFFDHERTRIDVLSLHLFGYGPERPPRGGAVVSAPTPVAP
jgi:hypothetical protein